MDSMVVLGLLNRKKGKCGSDLNDLSTSEWPDYVITLDGKNFSDFIQKYPLSVVDFWAPWCAPCRTMGSRLRRLSKIYKGKLAFGKLDIQANKDIAKKYKIMGIPHLMFFRYGKKVSNVIGVRSVGDLKDIIDDLLKK